LIHNLFQKYGSDAFGTFILVVYFNDTLSSTDCIMSEENNEIRRMCEDSYETTKRMVEVFYKRAMKNDCSYSKCSVVI